MTWLLILTLLSPSGPTSVAMGGSFNSEAACLSAGNAWIAQMKRVDIVAVVPRALCVPEKKNP